MFYTTLNTYLPKYTLTTEYIKQNTGFKHLKDPEFAPHELRIDECMRRAHNIINGSGYIRGTIKQAMDYINLANQIDDHLERAVIAEMSSPTCHYHQHPSAERHIQEGSGLPPCGTTRSIDGKRFVYYQRLWVHPARYRIMGPISDMKLDWNKLTLDAGKLQGDVAAYRQNAVLDGTARRILIKHGLNPQVWISKMLVTFN